MRILHLTLKRKWFDLIATGEKVCEYREIKQHWRSRFFGPVKGGFMRSAIKFDEIHFRNGYAPSAPFMRVEWRGLTITKYDGEPHYCIHLGKVLEVRNWKGTEE